MVCRLCRSKYLSLYLLSTGSVAISELGGGWYVFFSLLVMDSFVSGVRRKDILRARKLRLLVWVYVNMLLCMCRRVVIVLVKLLLFLVILVRNRMVLVLFKLMN